MLVQVDPDDVKVLDADDRGRVYLGSEFANADGVEIAILNDPSEGEE